MKQSEILCASLFLCFLFLFTAKTSVTGSAEQGRFIIHFQKETWRYLFLLEILLLVNTARYRIHINHTWMYVWCECGMNESSMYRRNAYSSTLVHIMHSMHAIHNCIVVCVGSSSIRHYQFLPITRDSIHNYLGCIFTSKYMNLNEKSTTQCWVWPREGKTRSSRPVPRPLVSRK